jgi:hypothetical protein
MILLGSKYKAPASPVAYIWNGKDTIPVTKGSVIYLSNNKPGSTAQVLVIGDKLNGCKDAFVTRFQVT